MDENTVSPLPGLLDEAWARYLKTLKRSRSIMTEESVHDLRVSLRRLQAVFDLTRWFLPASHAEKTHRALKEMRESLGPLRDVQVLILLTGDLVNTFPDLLKFEKHLVRREREIIQKLKKTIKIKRGRLRRNFDEAIAQSRDLLQMFTRAETEKTISIAIDKAYETVLEKKRSLDRDDAADIHDLRVVFKRFRYAIEAARPMLPEIPETRLATMRYLQQVMGDIQDTELLFGTLSRWGKRKKRRALASVYELMGRRRRDSIHAFLAKIDEIPNFWSPHPMQKARAAVPVRLIH